MDNVIRVGFKPSELTGVGLEWLVVNGLVIAKFYDGNFVHEFAPKGNDDVTKKAA